MIYLKVPKYRVVAFTRIIGYASVQRFNTKELEYEPIATFRTDDLANEYIEYLLFKEDTE